RARRPARARVRDCRDPADAKWSDVRSARGDAVSRAASARARQAAGQPMVGTERSPPAGLPAHGQGTARPRETADRMDDVRAGHERGRWRTAMTSPQVDAYVQR